MLDVKDILTIFNSAEVLKRIKATPARVDALENRIAELEKALTGNQRDKHRCQYCQSTDLTIDNVTPDKNWSRFGINKTQYRCNSCGKRGEINDLSKIISNL